MADLDPAATFAGVLRHQGSMTEAEIENVLSKSGRIVAGAFEADGEGRAVRAAQAAIAPLLVDGSIKQASGIMVEVASGENLSESEINTAAETIRAFAGPDTDMLICDLRDDQVGDAFRVTVIAAYFDS